jgi:hypothetical protein
MLKSHATRNQRLTKTVDRCLSSPQKDNFPLIGRKPGPFFDQTLKGGDSQNELIAVETLGNLRIQSGILRASAFRREAAN